jgi:hypothetical protein
LIIAGQHNYTYIIWPTIYVKPRIYVGSSTCLMFMGFCPCLMLWFTSLDKTKCRKPHIYLLLQFYYILIGLAEITVFILLLSHEQSRLEPSRFWKNLQTLFLRFCPHFSLSSLFFCVPAPPSMPSFLSLLFYFLFFLGCLFSIYLEAS